jgi:hypothetical protein
MTSSWEAPSSIGNADQMKHWIRISGSMAALAITNASSSLKYQMINLDAAPVPSRTSHGCLAMIS